MSLMHVRVKCNHSILLMGYPQVMCVQRAIITVMNVYGSANSLESNCVQVRDAACKFLYLCETQLRAIAYIVPW